MLFTFLLISKIVVGQSIVLSADDYFINPDNNSSLIVPITFNTIGFIDVASLTFDLIYDSNVLTPTACVDVIDFGICNPNFVDTLRYAGFNMSSIPYNSVIVNFHFDVDLNSFDFSILDISIINLFNYVSSDVTSFGNVDNGSVTIYCDPSLTFLNGNDFFNNDNEIFNTYQFIKANNNINAGAKINYEAAQYILLDNNFYVDMNANFNAEIKFCNSNN